MRAAQKKETGPARARLQFIGARPTITFLVHNGDEEVTREEWRFTEIAAVLDSIAGPFTSRWTAMSSMTISMPCSICGGVCRPFRNSRA
jgi:hypothetical protein